jgi:hypothetical protein
MSWLSMLGAFISVLIKKIINEVWRDAKHSKRQKEADRAAHDPAGAIADHFGGRVRQLPKASETDKTNT